MSLSLSLNNALSGLKAAQASLATISDNISNAQTPGYTRKSQPLTSVTTGGVGSGVATGTVIRLVDTFLRRDVQRQTSTLGAATVKDDFLSRVEDLLGSVSGGGNLTTDINKLQTNISALAASPENQGLQGSVVSSAKSAALDLNRTATSLQALRLESEQKISASVDTINTSLRQIQSLNQQITRASALGQPIGNFEDQRDQAVTALSKEMGVQTFVRDTGEMVVYTNGGRTLVDGIVNPISYKASPVVNSQTQFAPIVLGINGVDVTKEITTGELGGLMDVRDRQLPDLNNQLNVLARALYEQTWAPPAQPSTGFQLNGNLPTNVAIGTTQDVTLNGDYKLFDSSGTGYNGTVRLTAVAGGQWQVQILALATDATPPQIATSTPALPLTLGIFDPSTAGSIAIPQLSLTTGAPPGPATTMFAGGGQLFFGPSYYTQDNTKGVTVNPQNDTYRLFQGVNLIDPTAANASTIKVNSFFDADQTYNGAPGDPARLFVSGDLSPSVTERMLTKMTSNFSLSAPPYSTVGANLPAGNYTLSSLSTAITSQVARASSDASSTKSYQTEYVDALQQRASEVDGVNTDEELANMVVFQNSYAASAKVMDTVTKMFDTLLAIAT